MKTKAHLQLACLALSVLPVSLHAQAIKYMGGSGTILEGTKSSDGEYAVVLNDAGDNVIVNLRTKNEVHKMTAEDDWQFPYFPGLNHGSLDVTWGPDQEGSRFGILIYGAKWETAKAFLVVVDPEFGEQRDIIPVLNDAAWKWAKASGAPDPDGLCFRYTVTGVDAPDGEMVINDPLDIRVEYYGEIPKSEEETGATGTIRLRLERTRLGPVAKELNPAVGERKVAVDEGHHAELRKMIEFQVKEGGLKKAKAHPESEVEGRKLAYMGHLEANVLKRLVYVDFIDDDNDTFVRYYWVNGLLVSAIEVRSGSDTGQAGVDEVTEIYNFDEQRLVSWISDGVEQDPDTEGFAQLGFSVLEQSIERAGVIYAEIGAD